MVTWWLYFISIQVLILIVETDSVSSVHFCSSFNVCICSRENIRYSRLAVHSSTRYSYSLAAYTCEKVNISWWEGGGNLALCTPDTIPTSFTYPLNTFYFNLPFVASKLSHLKPHARGFLRIRTRLGRVLKETSSFWKAFGDFFQCATYVHFKISDQSHTVGNLQTVLKVSSGVWKMAA